MLGINVQENIMMWFISPQLLSSKNHNHCISHNQIVAQCMNSNHVHHPLEQKYWVPDTPAQPLVVLVLETHYFLEPMIEGIVFRLKDVLR